MPKTMSEKILAKAAGKDEVEAGDIVIANIDVAMTHDLTGPLSVQSFEKIGATKVWDPSKIVIPFDHQVPADSIDSANNHIIMRKFVILVLLLVLTGCEKEDISVNLEINCDNVTNIVEVKKADER